MRGEQPRYRLYTECSDRLELDRFTAALDHALGDASGYRYARSLTQLAPLEGVRVTRGEARYRQAMIDAGLRAGDVKPSQLDARLDWEAVFAADIRSASAINAHADDVISTSAGVMR
jgi:hypothetical protein